jgi:hypothetical protein
MIARGRPAARPTMNEMPSAMLSKGFEEKKIDEEEEDDEDENFFK